MCDRCGCELPDSQFVPAAPPPRSGAETGAGSREIQVHERILAGNDRLARHNRAHFVEHGLLAVNVMGAPGAGKTALLEATVRATTGRWRVAAIEGDQATQRD